MTGAWVALVVFAVLWGAFEWWNRRFWRRHETWRAAHPLPIPMEQRIADARIDAVVEMHERAAMDCVMCDLIGEPHVCERQWWRDRLAHHEGRVCSDVECPCHESMRLREESRALWPTR